MLKLIDTLTIDLIVLFYIVFKITHGTQFIISHKKRLKSVEIQLGNHVFHTQPIDSLGGKAVRRSPRIAVKALKGLLENANLNPRQM